MQASQSGPLAEFARHVWAYLPTLAAGFLVFILGIGLGWVVKRALVRVLVWFRLDRLGGRAGWRAAFGKGDVRAALYEMVGNVAMAIVVLLFLDNALQILRLTVLSRSVESVVFYLPNVALVALIVLIGFVATNVLGDRVEDALEEEGFEHARLLARIVKALLQAVVVALALWQLGFAREIVLAGFLIAFGAFGVAFAVAVGLGSARAIQHGWEDLFRKGGKKEE
jgi:hypothetical protein